MSKVGAVVLNYNDAETTKHLVNTIKDYRSLTYIVIVDNCSKDNSYYQLKQMESDKIYVIQTEKNGGYGYGNQAGIRFAFEQLKCKYTLVANPDVFFTEEVISELVNHADSLDKCAVISCMQNNEHVKNLQSAWKVPSGAVPYALNFLKLLGKAFSLNYNPQYLESADVIEVGCIQGAMILINNKMFLDSGGYDEHIFLYCEETSIGLRIHKMGYNSFLCTNISYNHYHSQSVSKDPSVLRKRTSIIIESKKRIIEENWNISSVERILIDIIFEVAYFERKLLKL